jgi:hypothetical protein
MAGPQQEELLELMFSWALQIPPFIDFVERQFFNSQKHMGSSNTLDPYRFEYRIPKKCSSCLEATEGSGKPRM